MTFGVSTSILSVFLISALRVSLIAARTRNTVPRGKHIITLPSNDMSENHKLVIAIKGDIVILQCQFRAEERWSNIQWVKFKRGDENIPVQLKPKLVNTSNNSSNATIANVKKRNEANYTCMLTTFTSGPESYSFQLVVKKESSCKNSSCFYNGRCVESINGYNCSCNSGFIGRHCEHEDPCLSLPCLNNATCISEDDGFNCSCRTGYGGTMCEKEVCSPNICGVGGICQLENGKIKCICSSRLAGRRCQYRCSSGSGGYCRYSRRTCLISFRDNTTIEDCSCDDNRQSGDFKCMMKSDLLNECENPNICNGHGNCYDQKYGYRCQCHRYASGKNCELYNECNAGRHICSTNGATCVDLVNGYKCTNCPPGQHGDKCQYKEDPCKVTCQQTTMTAECDMRFLSVKMRNIPIYLNSRTSSCQLQYDGYRSLTWRRNFHYTYCGTETEYGENYVTYRNYLRAGDFNKTRSDSNSVITRVAGHFEFKMECRLPLLRNVSGRMLHYTLSLNETMDLQDQKSISVSGTTYVYLYKEVEYQNHISRYTVGDRLYVKVFLSGNQDLELRQGFELYVVTCYATPGTTDLDEEMRYYLIKDGCVLDDTLQLLHNIRHDKRIVYFSLDSFTFKSKPGELALHCTTRVCLKRQGVHDQDNCEVKCEDANELQERRSYTTAPSPLSPSPAIANGTIDRISRSSVDVITDIES